MPANKAAVSHGTEMGDETGPEELGTAVELASGDITPLRGDFVVRDAPRTTRPPRSSALDLRGHLAKVTAAREEVRQRRRSPVTPKDLSQAHADLTAALAGYATELGRLNIPIPPRLRDEIRLHHLGQSPGSHEGWSGNQGDVSGRVRRGSG